LPCAELCQVAVPAGIHVQRVAPFCPLLLALPRTCCCKQAAGQAPAAAWCCRTMLALAWRSRRRRCSWHNCAYRGSLTRAHVRVCAGQGTTGQNRTKQTRAQKQAKQTKTNKALFTEQAADFGMWQQSRAAYAGRRQIHAIMESTSRSYCYQSPWQGTANLQLVRTHMCTPTVGENDEKYDHFKVTLTYKRPAEK
jgi:hypothetical protein